MKYLKTYEISKQLSNTNIYNLMKKLNVFLKELDIKYDIEHFEKTKDYTNNSEHLMICFLSIHKAEDTYFNIYDECDLYHFDFFQYGDEISNYYNTVIYPITSYIEYVINTVDYHNIDECDFNIDNFKLIQNVNKYNL